MLYNRLTHKLYLILLQPATYQNILQEIINKITQEEDKEIKEVLLNLVSSALSYRDCIKGLDLLNLITVISSLNTDALIHTLDIIGLSRDKKYTDSITPFLKHSVAEVRETARLALNELGVDNSHTQ